MKGPAAGATLALNGVESYEIETKANGVAKVEKTKEFKEATLLANPLGKVEEALEKKLRNLEKRRQKQQQLKQELECGKTLTDEQKEAILMINEVERQVEWIKEVLKMTQQSGRQYQRAVKQRDEAERKNGLETATDDIKAVVQLRELSMILNEDGAKEALAKELNEEELRALDQISGLLQPLDGFDSFGDWYARLGKSAKSIHAVIRGFEEEVFDGFTGAVVKNLVEKIAASEFVQQLHFKNATTQTQRNVATQETNVAAQTQEVPEEREQVESSTSPSLSTVSSHKTDSAQSQLSSQVSAQAGNEEEEEDIKKDSETPEAKVVFVANDSAQTTNGNIEGQFVFAAEPVTENVAQNMPVVPTFIPGPAPVFVPVMTIPAPFTGTIPPQLIQTSAAPAADVPNTEVQNGNAEATTNGNYAQNRQNRRRDGPPRNNYGFRRDGPRRDFNGEGPRGPRPQGQGPRPYRQQSSHDSNSGDSSTNADSRPRNGDNFQRSQRPHNGNGYRGGNRGGQPRDNPPPKPKYQYGFRFADN